MQVVGLYRGIAAVTAYSDWMKCALAIKDLIVAMSVAAWTEDTVLIYKLPWNRPELNDGGVILSDGRPARVAASNLADEDRHAVLVTALTQTNQDHDNTTQLEQLLDWRETLRDGLIGTTLPTAKAYDTMIVPGQPVISGAFREQYDATQLTVICKVRDRD
jgi:hypothetical protein